MGDWPHGKQDAIGQAGEFLVWAALITQSGGGLHVFLPILDRGIDGLIHRLDDGAYLALQVKTKTAFHSGEAPIAVLESHLFTDDQFVIGAQLDGDQLGEYTLVADGATYRSRAARMVDRGRVLLVADIPLRPESGHKWSDELVPTDKLAARLGAPPRERLAPAVVPALAEVDRVMGSLGEQEVCRRLATLEDCGLFRPFPDSEMTEVVVRRLATGSTLGIQVKTAQLGQRHDVRHVLINRATFVGAPSIVVVLAWIVPERRFHETCLVLPAQDVPSLASIDGPYYELHFRADGSRESSRLDRYRTKLEDMATELANLL